MGTKKRLILSDLFSFNNEGVKTGHYFALARNYQKIFKDIFDVKIAGGYIYKTGFSDEELILLPHESYKNDNTRKHLTVIMRNCRSLMQQTTSDDIIIMQQAKPATCILALALLSKKKRNIILIEYDTSGLSSSVKRVIYNMARRNIRGVICPSEIIGKAFKLPYCVVPDYIFDKEIDLLKSVKFRDKKYDIAMVGRIEPEKGIVEAAEYLAGKPCKILIAGKANEQTIDKLKSIGNSVDNIDLKLGFVSNEDYQLYISISKFVMLNYQGAYTNRSSGVVLDSIFNGTPVVGRRCMASQFVEDENMGRLFDDIHDFDISIVNDEIRYRTYIENIEQYLQKHKKFVGKIIDFLQNIKQ